MTTKDRIEKLEKAKPKEKLRQMAKAYFDSLSNDDLERMRDHPETFSQKELAEFNQMWDVRYRVMGDGERELMDEILITLLSRPTATIEPNEKVGSHGL